MSPTLLVYVEHLSFVVRHDPHTLALQLGLEGLTCLSDYSQLLDIDVDRARPAIRNLRSVVRPGERPIPTLMHLSPGTERAGAS